MSTALKVARAASAPAAAARPAALGRSGPPALARRLAAQLRNGFLPRAAWTIERTGRPGLVGIALLLAAATFLLSTHREVAAEVEALRAELAAAQGRARASPADEAAAAPAALRALPPRADVPAIVRQLFDLAVQSRLAVDTAKYEVNATRRNGVVRYQIAFPVSGPYPRIRAFLDETLATMPAVALGDLALERRSIGDADVEAQIKMTAYTAEAGPARAPAPRAPAARPASDRVVSPTYAAALFAQRSWHVPAPVKAAPPPPPPPPPPEPTAPPLPYTFLGSYAPAGSAPVFILSRGDRVIEARPGDRLDGVYRLESAAGGQLVFVYLPLDIRQTLAAGASK
jgi:Tfp pilus assembly protein PilO